MEEAIEEKDWIAFCKRKKIEGIDFEKAKKLNNKILAHLLAIQRKMLSGSGEKIRSPLAVAKMRAAQDNPSKEDIRTIQAWLHPPPKSSEVIDPNKPFIKTHKCHCGGELKSEYAAGSGETTYICKKCARGYPKR